MQRSTVSCKTEKITCETHGKWALIHSKCIKIENMPPQLAVGLCRCWLSKGSTPWWQPTLLSKPQGAVRGLALSPKLVLCSSTWPRQDNGQMLCPPWWQSPRTVSSQRGTLLEGTCHPHWRPDSVRHQHLPAPPAWPWGVSLRWCLAQGDAPLRRNHM